MARTRSVRTFLGCRSTAATRRQASAKGTAKTRGWLASLSQRRRCLAAFIDLKPQIKCSNTSTVALLRRRNNRHRFAPLTSTMVRRSPFPLLALAALSAAFVPPQQPRLAVRVRADEIDAVEDDAPAERTAPEVNSGAERCRNRIVATRPRHRLLDSLDDSRTQARRPSSSSSRTPRATSSRGTSTIKK